MFASAECCDDQDGNITMFRHIPTPPQLHTSHIANQSTQQEKTFPKLSRLDESTLLYLAIIIASSLVQDRVSVVSLTKLN